MKTSKDYLEEANAVVPKIAFEDAMEKHRGGKAVFIDVRDSNDIAQTGTVKGALRIPRGLIEFSADKETPFYNEKLTKDADIVVFCGKGGQAALTGKTLKEMGYEHVQNAGGFPAWKEKGGPTEG